MTVLAVLGANALWLIYVWLLSAIVASYLSDRKGYGEKVGLASGPAAVRHRPADLARLAGAAGVEVEDARPVRPGQARHRARASSHRLAHPGSSTSIRAISSPRNA